LLLVALPSFALPPCSFCEEEGGPGPCIFDTGGGTVCRIVGGVCTTRNQACIGFVGRRMLLAEWNVTSIEMTHIDRATGRVTSVVTNPTAVAQAKMPAPALK
jgi:hypothetical protein